MFPEQQPMSYKDDSNIVRNINRNIFLMFKCSKQKLPENF